MCVYVMSLDQLFSRLLPRWQPPGKKGTHVKIVSTETLTDPARWRKKKAFAAKFVLNLLAWEFSEENEQLHKRPIALH